MSKCWYCNEELTTANYCDEHIGICTKCYASMFQVSNEFVKGLMDKIADLEVKLAELQECVLRASAKHNLEMQNAQICIKELEAKLAEKDHTIETLVEDSKASKELLKKQLAEKDNLLKIYPRLEDMYPQLPTIVIGNQDKISFAVEQLEKVKELVEEKSMTQSPFGTQKIYASDVGAIVDSQIEELKKETK